VKVTGRQNLKGGGSSAGRLRRRLRTRPNHG